MPSLSSHPIFQIVQTQYAHFKDDSRRNAVAFKGTEVYVAVGSTVRCAELRDDSPEEESKEKKPYQTLEFPNVTFPIKEILWNHSGTHLALVGSHDLAVISFPRLGLTSNIKVDNIPPKVFQIGKNVYDKSNAIRKVAFHPYSKHDNTLVVLSTDSHLRVFELSVSPHYPEQDIELFPPLKRGYTVDFDIPVPMSFSFGAGIDWMIWAVFILTKDGDIYVLCPLMPTKCIMTRSAVARMKALITHRAEKSQRSKMSLIDRETCLNQTRWIGDILGQISMGEFMGVTSSPAFTGVDIGDMVSFKRPNKVRPTPEIQGAILFQPAPRAMDIIFPQASDIAILDAEGVTIVVTTWRGGRVDIGILLDGIEGVWSVKGASSTDRWPIRLASYENIDISAGKNAWTGILTSRNDNEGVFVTIGPSVWHLDFRGWLHELQRLNQDEDDDEDVTPIKPVPTMKSLLVNELPSLIVGYGILFDPLLDYHLMTISSSGHAQFTELALPTVSSPSSVLQSPATIKSRRTTKPASYLAYPFPDDTPLASPGQIIRRSLRIPPAILREKDPVSMDAIKLLGDVTVRIRNTVGSVLQLAEGLRRRLELQQKELSAHLSKVSATYENVKDLQANAESRNSRLATVKQSQTNLETRANILLRKLLTINAPQTSEAEEKWFKELARVKARLDGQRGLLAEARARVAEGKRLLELAGKRTEHEDEEAAGGKNKLDARVMDAIEEATRKVEKMKIRTARLSEGVQ